MCSHHRKPLSVRKNPAEVLVTPGHPRWEEFLDRLTGPLGLDVRDGSWHCAGGEDKSHCRRILLAMGLSPATVETNLTFFERHGGYCDCEVWMNVERSVAWGEAGVRDQADGPADLLPGDIELWGDEW